MWPVMVPQGWITASRCVPAAAEIPALLASEPLERWAPLAWLDEIVEAPARISRIFLPEEISHCAPRPGSPAAHPAEPAERWAEPTVRSASWAACPSPRNLPFALAAIVPEPLQGPVGNPPLLQASWADLLAAEPAERCVIPATALFAIMTRAAAHGPSFPLAATEPFVPAAPRFARPLPPEPAELLATAVCRLVDSSLPVAVSPVQQRAGWSGERALRPAPLAEARFELRAVPSDPLPVRKAPIPIRRSPAPSRSPAATLRLAQVPPAQVTKIYPAAASGASNMTASITFKLAGAIAPKRLATAVGGPVAQMPEFDVRRIPCSGVRCEGTPSPRLEWMLPKVSIAFHRFQLKPAIESYDEQAAAHFSCKDAPLAEVLPLPEVKQPTLELPDLGWAGKAAAAVLLAFAVWSGAKVARFGKRPAAAAAQETPPLPRLLETPFTARQYQAPAGPIARLRQAIVERAAVSVADSFHNGMESWGSGPHQWAPRWSRSADGYVRVGDLALFRPTQNFTDYRLEFYGQIEKKGMGWVMRAKDKQNYYAMKVTVLEPGLRPIFAMVHYPVVGGKKGHKVETPLSIMVHNNTPYHVTVDVKGNHFTASIEGEEVDSWTDDAPSAGSVGFFSEAGESARLYWAKVSKNQDWIGRICSYLVGRRTSQAAELWNGESPDPTRAPSRWYGVHFLAVCIRRLEEDLVPRRATIKKNWRNRSWIS
jgi:hypothetical protein